MTLEELSNLYIGSTVKVIFDENMLNICKNTM